MDALQIGTTVRLRRDIERYPHFIAGKGLTGTVVDASEFQIRVRMDDHIDGAEDWENEVHWYDADWEMTPDILEQDLEVIGVSATTREP